MAQMSLVVVEKRWVDFASAHIKALFFSATVSVVIYPTVYLFRLINFSPLFILAGTAVVSAIFLILIIRFAPVFFLGKEGLWLLNLLHNYLPKKLQLKHLTEYGKSSPETI
jgi:hypothetical protein